MSARWEETLGAWRQFREHWELGLRDDPRGARIDEGIDRVIEIARGAEWGGAGFLLEILGGTFPDAQPIYVSEDVVTLWQHAQQSFEPEPLRSTDLFTRSGFALFPVAVEFLQKNDTVPNPLCRGVIWVSDESEVWVFAVSHRNDTRDARPGTWTITMTTGFRLDNDAIATGDGEVQRQLQSFWRLAQQVIATPERLPRARRREERRNGSTRDTVTVLRLRRTGRRENTESRDVEWSRRWIVRGHWRNQWYPSLGVHRQIWVSPYVKGPDDKPLVPTQRIVEFIQ